LYAPAAVLTVKFFANGSERAAWIEAMVPINSAVRRSMMTLMERRVIGQTLRPCGRSASLETEDVI
jgi:hypothetical protein